MLSRSCLLLSLIAIFLFGAVASTSATTVSTNLLSPGANHSSGSNTHPYYSMNGGPATAPATAAPSSQFGRLMLHTPASGGPGHGPQESVGHRSPLAAPEPGALLLLSTGLMGMAGLIRRKLGS
jgi:hypothetical protein